MENKDLEILKSLLDELYQIKEDLNKSKTLYEESDLVDRLNQTCAKLESFYIGQGDIKNAKKYKTRFCI